MNSENEKICYHFPVSLMYDWNINRRYQRIQRKYHMRWIYIYNAALFVLMIVNPIILYGHPLDLVTTFVGYLILVLSSPDLIIPLSVKLARKVGDKVCRRHKEFIFLVVNDKVYVEDRDIGLQQVSSLNEWKKQGKNILKKEKFPISNIFETKDEYFLGNALSFGEMSYYIPKKELKEEEIKKINNCFEREFGKHFYPEKGREKRNRKRINDRKS